MGVSLLFFPEPPASFAPRYPTPTPVPARRAPFAIPGSFGATLPAISFTLETAPPIAFLTPGPAILLAATLAVLAIGAAAFIAPLPRSLSPLTTAPRPSSSLASSCSTNSSETESSEITGGLR